MPQHYDEDRKIRWDLAPFNQADERMGAQMGPPTPWRKQQVIPDLPAPFPGAEQATSLVNSLIPKTPDDIVTELGVNLGGLKAFQLGGRALQGLKNAWEGMSEIPIDEGRRAFLGMR